jgi:hypothetical protein
MEKFIEYNNNKHYRIPFLVFKNVKYLLKKKAYKSFKK